MRLGEGSQAFAHCKRGRKLNDRYRPGVRTAIQLAVLRGRYDDASSIATELGEAFPNAPDVSFAVVRALVAQRDVEAAEEQINRWAGKPVAESHEAKMAEGLLAFRRNKFRSALGYFQRAHEATPRDVEAAVYYAWTAARLGEDDGEDILRDRLSDPLWGPRAWQALGELRRRQGELRDARENLSEALEDYRKSIAPKWRESESYAELARTWADERDWDHYLTRRFVSRAVTRGDAESVPAHMIRGEYKLEKRRRERDEAADHFERVLAREPYNCEAIDYLLDIYDDLRRDDDEERIEELEDKYCE
jgi:tetratricopeptide (TPR) repeat protein